MTVDKNETLQQWYQEFYPAILAYCRKRLSSPEDAEDLAQSIFLLAARKFELFDPASGSAQGWLYTIAANRYKDFLKYQSHRNSISFEDYMEDHDAEHADNSMQQTVELTEKRALLAQALAALPERYRRAVVLQYFGNYTTQQMAEALGVSEKNFRVILCRGLKQLRRELELLQA